MLPALGGGSTLRGFSSWRFRDRHSLLLQAEWRVLVSPFIDMALFYDAGKVTASRSDLDFDGLKTDFGVGFRLHGPMVTPLRIELAKGNEGLHVIFSSSASVLRNRIMTRLHLRAVSRPASRRPILALAVCGLLVAALDPIRSADQKFYSDDPLATAPETGDASGALP